MENIDHDLDEFQRIPEWDLRKQLRHGVMLERRINSMTAEQSDRYRSIVRSWHGRIDARRGYAEPRN